MTPARFTAVRVPADARSVGWPWICSPRTRAVRPPGRTSTSSPTDRAPETNVPVTTVPKPRREKARSTGSRSTPPSGRGGASSPRVRSASRSAARPVPDGAATRRTGRPSRNEPLTSSWTSSSARAWLSASARSHFVRTTRPRGMPRRRQIWKCSRVCGMTDSSAATTSATASIPWAPASMLRTKRSCPGTSTKDAVSPSPRSRWAKPRSTVIPRSFSSLRRSGSVPVKARTRALLPWSMCPAVPTISERGPGITLPSWSPRTPTRRSCVAWPPGPAGPPSRSGR